jgi:WD40 repeat protein
MVTDPALGLLVTGDDDGLITVRRAADGRPLRTMRLPGGRHVWSLALGPDGHLVSAADDGQLQVWDTATGTSVAGPVATGDPAPAVAVSPDGRLIASGGDDMVLRLWTPQLVQAHAPVKAHTNRVMGLAFRPGDGALFSVGFDGAVLVWHIAGAGAPGTASQALTVRHEVVGREQAGIFALAVSGDGRTVATGDNDGRVTFWDADARDALAARRPGLGGGRPPVLALTFGGGSDRLVSTDDDGAVRLMTKVDGWRDLGVVGRWDGVPARSVAVTGSSATVGSEKGISRWTLDPATWSSLACAVAGRAFADDELAGLPASVRGLSVCPGQVAPPPVASALPAEDD